MTTSQPLKWLLGPVHHLQVQPMSSTALALYPADRWDWRIQPAKPRVFGYIYVQTWFTTKPWTHLCWPCMVWGCFSGNYILESSHAWSPQNTFLKFSLPRAAVPSCWVMTTGVMLPWLQLRVQSRCSDLSYISLGVAKIIYRCNHYILFKGKHHIRTETCGLQTYYFLPENLSKATIKCKTKAIQNITGALSQI